MILPTQVRTKSAAAEITTTPITGLSTVGTARADYTHYAVLDGGDNYTWTVDVNNKSYASSNDVNEATGIYSGAAFTAIVSATGTFPAGLTFVEERRSHRIDSYSNATCNPANSNPPVGKADAMIAVGTDLYMILEDQGVNVTGGNWNRGKLGVSTDGGKTFTFTKPTFSSDDATWDILDGVFQNGGFCQFGPGYTNVPARFYNGATPYVYICDAEENAANVRVYLARVPVDAITTIGSWEYYTGSGWSSTKSSKAAIMDAANYTGVTKFKFSMSMTYIRAIDRFAFMAQVNDTNRVALLEAPEPQGPWTLVSTYDIEASGEKISPQILPEGAGLSTVKNGNGTVDCIFKLGGYSGTGLWDTLHLKAVQLVT